MGSSNSIENSKNIQRFEYINHNTGDILNYYEILSHIGIGKSATVYHAIDGKTKLPRAVKELRKSNMNRESTDAFESEVKTLKSLDHPNIMKIYEVIESPYAYYLACELLTGPNLLEVLLDEHKGIDDLMICKCMEDILYAISYCHHEQIIHNDLRPDNLVFEDKSATGKLKLIDFGISCKVQESKGNYGQVHYRAPETFETSGRALSDQVIVKADVWSAGVIFYTLLTRKPLFRGKGKKLENDIFGFDTETLGKEIEDKRALSLLESMLSVDPDIRISANDALNHEYFCGLREFDLGLKMEISSTLDKMNAFSIRSNLNTKMMSLVAVHLLSAEEEKTKSSVFRTIDEKHDGYVDREELLQASKRFGFDQEKIETIMENCDLDRNGKISYTELLTTSMNWKDFLRDGNKLETILSYFDLLHKDNLTQKELMNITKVYNKDEWREFFQLYKDKEGFISKHKLEDYFIKIAESFDYE